MVPGEEQGAPEGEQGSPARPDYKVYRSRPGLISRLRAPDLSSLREKVQPKRPSRPERPSARAEPSLARRIGKWALIAAIGWILVSLVAFAVSAQIQQWRLAGDAEDELGGNPLLLADPQTILVMGTDARPEGNDEAGAESDPECLDEGEEGDSPSEGCAGFRADTLMLVQAGGATFRKLSIPRDTYAEIPGIGAGKINSAFANGGAALQIATVENFLGIDIDHAVIIDLDGFRDLIDSIGGVEVDLPNQVCSEINGGAANGGFSLDVGPGEATLTGDEAVALARTRVNTCTPGEDDRDRAARQQLIVSGIKDRLTSPFRLPYNFIKGPWIGWTAPKAMVSDMGAVTTPQLLLSSAVGGDSEPQVLADPETTQVDSAGNLIIPFEDCVEAVEELLGKSGPRDPACSPTA